MKASEVLKSIPFGQGVAEKEKQLETYFVKTPAFWEVINDESDLILGTKGSGKTAISRIVSSATALRHSDISDLDDVLIVTAFSAGASTIFSSLGNNVEEDVLRRLWMAYLLGVAGNSVLDHGGEKPSGQDELSTLMQRSGLRAENTPAKDQLKKLLSADLIGPTAAEDQIGSTSPTPAWANAQFDFLALAQTLNNFLAGKAQRCWILLDRLDEAFSFKPDLEQRALRALLRAHLDLSSEVDRLATKIFLRSDIFERVTRNQRFANLDHFRVVRLKWQPSDITRLLSERILASGEFARGELAEEPDDRVVDWCIPSSYTYFDGRRYKMKNSLDWCLEVSASRQNESSPRNLLLLLKEAQRNALTRIGEDAQYVSGRPLLEEIDLTYGWSMLSAARLEDTLFAEMTHLRRYIETFKHQPSRVTRQTLESRFRPIGGDDDIGEVIRDLESAGFLHSSHVDLFDVAPLYRPALDIEAALPGIHNGGGAVVLNTTVDAAPEVIRQRAKELVRNGARAEAVSLLIKHSSIPEENAVLATNIAIESGDPDALSRVDSLLSRDEYAGPLIGRRIVLKLVTGRSDAARSLIESVSNKEIEQLNDILRHFVAALTFNAEVENETWLYLLNDGISSDEESNWTRLVPIVAASRFLAVVRGLGAQDFGGQANRLADEWFGGAHGAAIIPKQSLESFLDAYCDNFMVTPITMFPYQVISLVHIFDRLYTVPTELKEKVLRELVRHVKVGAEKHQRSFQDWATLDALAQEVANMVKQSEV